jgi:hypothetical protein
MINYDPMRAPLQDGLGARAPLFAYDDADRTAAPSSTHPCTGQCVLVDIPEIRDH